MICWLRRIYIWLRIGLKRRSFSWSAVRFTGHRDYLFLDVSFHELYQCRSCKRIQGIYNFDAKMAAQSELKEESK